MKVLLFANTEWYLYNFRRSLAMALREAGHEVLLVSPPGPYGDKLRELGFRWIAAPMERRSLNPLRELSLLYWLLRLMKQERVDLVHGFTIKCAVYGSLAARCAGIAGRVNAVTGMGYVFTSGEIRAQLLRPVVRGLLRMALDGRGARLILQNPDDVTLFREAGLVDMSRVRLIRGSGVDCSRFVAAPNNALSLGGGQSNGGEASDLTRPHPNPPPMGNAVEISRHTGMDCRYPEHRDVNLVCPPWLLGSGNPCRNDEHFLNSTALPPMGEGTLELNSTPLSLGGRQANGSFRVLLASRLLWDKGLAEYVSAARELKTQGRAINFLLAGLPDSGNPAAVPEEMIRAWVDEGILDWLGHVDDMPNLLSSVDVVVLPSYREGLPKGLIEAAACGLPLITTDVTGCREVVTHEIDGLLVPVRDAKALAQAIARLQDDPALAERLGEAAREKALAQFDERIVIEQTLAVYQELISWEKI